MSQQFTFQKQRWTEPCDRFAEFAARPHASLHAALEELMASSFGRSDWLLAYWTRPVLFSVAARRGWVEPDLKPLPFPSARSG